MLYDGIFQGMHGSTTIAWWSEYNKNLYKDLKWSWPNSDIAKLKGEDSGMDGKQGTQKHKRLSQRRRRRKRTHGNGH